MSFLHVYHEADGEQPLLSTTDPRRMALEVEPIGIQFDRCELTELPVGVDAQQLMVLHNDVSLEIQRRSGCGHLELRGMSPFYPDLELRRELLFTEAACQQESWNLLLRGQTIFYLHHDNRVYVLGCDRGDLISVPADMPHWLDIGPAPDFLMLCFQHNASHRLAASTSDIANRFPRYEALIDGAAA